MVEPPVDKAETKEGSKSIFKPFLYSEDRQESYLTKQDKLEWVLSHKEFWWQKNEEEKALTLSRYEE
jgi:hypothetical protein